MPPKILPIRESASLIMMSRNKILFLRRPPNGSYPGAHVFPGGVREDGDASMEITALRETFEESGILIDPKLNSVAYDRTSCSNVYEQALSAAAEPGSTFPYKYRWRSSPSENLQLQLFSSWLTPPIMAKKSRFYTYFYLLHMPDTAPPLAPIAIEPNPHAVKSGELLSSSMEWLTATEALELFDHRKLKLFPPQYYLLRGIKTEGISSFLDRVGQRVIQPEFKKRWTSDLVDETDTPARTILMDWGHGEGGEVTVGKDGVPIAIKYIQADLAKL
ncbi:hypothetical protein NADFUDRAFT_51542 [Nadsonia fulvescens var. elongata DSM 6958]|uniref:Nudix hydrolase domain-containing protein n=1 Tax=Nadsonia fulvescens var. elongata DSM 6958 TaxID=857566 RepID=A0A1E3PIB6_9ASCO|nr:hypothetical protein NADFUDRAFT_51542 [Nadsonia fulvescens var. elongata DSM 6958]